jgi:hypothetical protein
MTTTEVANRLVELCGAGEFLQAEKELYATEIVHVETDGKEFKGFETVYAKEEEFLKQLKSTPQVKVSDPIVAGSYFSIRMEMAFNHNIRGEVALQELIIYKVANGKIIYLQCFAG